MNEQVIYVHGAFMSPTSFNYLINSLPEHNIHYFEYNANKPIEQTGMELVNLINSFDEPVHLVGHSLGGVLVMYAALSAHNRAKSITTIASPLGGCEIARFPLLGMVAPVLRNVHPNHPVLSAIRTNDNFLADRMMNVVATSGRESTFMGQNDWVISVDSQTALWYGEEVRVDANHFEVLLRQETVNAIAITIFNVDNV